MKTTVFIITILLNGLSAGFFYAWSVSVILGTKKVGDFTYLETMQNINREILNPLFYIVFFWSLIAVFINAFLQFDNKPVFWIALSSAVIYLIGLFGVTALGNVPLNNALDVLHLEQLSPLEMKQFRMQYESKWNMYQNIRTVAGVISFFTLIISSFIYKSH
tara:strand:+ start:948 stop:1433 length:486 start_codon:yes stop_codon:yes gene_type:complete